MSVPKYFSCLALIFTLTACSSEDNPLTSSANDSYEVNALLTCNEVATPNDETKYTIYCEQPDSGMTDEMISPYIAALTTCGVSWQTMQDRRLNEYVFSDVVSNYFTNDLSAESSLTPIEALNIFNLPVRNFRSGFGLLPGFFAGFDSDFETIKSTLASSGINFDACENRSCELQLTDTETLILRDNIFGCAYPFQR